LKTILNNLYSTRRGGAIARTPQGCHAFWLGSKGTHSPGQQEEIN
jgi:hypothetical protein